MHMVLVGSSTNHGSIAAVYLWWNFDVVAIAGDGVAHNDLIPHVVHKEDTTVAATKQLNRLSAATPQIQALRRDAIGRVQDGPERDLRLEVLE
jgi:hypothetical protein